MDEKFAKAIKSHWMEITSVDGTTVGQAEAYIQQQIYSAISEKSSLHMTTIPQTWWRMAPHVNDTLWSGIIVAYRYMNAGLGNRDDYYRNIAVSTTTGRVIACPLCLRGPNNEVHI